MKNKCKGFHFNNSLTQLIILPLTLLIFSACSSSSGDGGNGSGGSSGSSCDTIANPDGPAFFKVENNLNSGLQWVLLAFAFGADMKSGECTIMGVTSSQFTVELQQCNIGDASCTSTFGATKSIVFSVVQGETYTLTVDSNTFNQ